MGEEEDAAKHVLSELAGEVYRDGLKPAVVPLGEALGDTARFLRAPFKMLGMLGAVFDELLTRVGPFLKERTERIPPERRLPPPKYVAVPVVAGLLTAEDTPPLRDLYLNLLAAAMDKDRVGTVHPAFAEALRQMTPDEALMVPVLEGGGLPLRRGYYFKVKGRGNYSNSFIFTTLRHLERPIALAFPEGLSTYIVNLERLGLLRFNWDSTFSTDDPHHGMFQPLHPYYKLVEQEPEIERVRAAVPPDHVFRLCGDEIRMAGESPKSGVAEATPFGVAFARACLGAPSRSESEQLPANETRA